MTPNLRWLTASATVLVLSMALAWNAQLDVRKAKLELPSAEAQLAQVQKKVFAARARLAAIKRSEEALKTTAASTPENPSTSRKTLVEVMDPDWSEVVAEKHRLPWSDLTLQADSRLQAAFVRSQQATAETRYGNFLQERSISSLDQSRFNSLFAENEERLMDIRATARAQGLAPTDPAIATLLKQNEGDFRRAQESILGRDGLNQLKEFDRTQAARDFVYSVGGNLSLEGIPLGAEQAAQLTRLIAEANASYQAGGAVSPITYTGPTGVTLDDLISSGQPAQSAFIPNDVLGPAKAILSREQYAKLEAKVLSNQNLIELFNLMLQNSPQRMAGFRLQTGIRPRSAK